MSDPYFDSEILRPSYDASHRGGLTGRLLAAHYAVAYFSQRGHRILSECLAPSTPRFERPALYVSNCVDEQTRSKVDLETITSDTTTILEMTSAEARARHIPLVVLAYSLGMHNVASAVGAHPRLGVSGIVSVGGAFRSVAETADYQLTQKAFLGSMEVAFERCKSASLTVDDALQCAGKPTTKEWVIGVRNAMEVDKFSIHDVQVKRELWQQRYEGFRQLSLDAPESGSIDGNFEGVGMPRNWSAKYFPQIFRSHVGSPALLAGFPGHVVYMFGEYDQLVQIPTLAAFESETQARKLDAQLEIVPRVNYILADGSGFPSDKALNMIVDALNQVSVGGNPR